MREDTYNFMKRSLDETYDMTPEAKAYRNALVRKLEHHQLLTRSNAAHDHVQQAVIMREFYTQAVSEASQYLQCTRHCDYDNCNDSLNICKFRQPTLFTAVTATEHFPKVETRGDLSNVLPAMIGRLHDYDYVAVAERIRAQNYYDALSTDE